MDCAVTAHEHRIDNLIMCAAKKHACGFLRMAFPVFSVLLVVLW